ncbi:hypothetical protein [Aerosakkonema funiforme]|uniref:hypothetical protein n=1 Tax=Aerosakkonema funiforme TaxID=1246630 RepID=UPI0035B978AD
MAIRIIFGIFSSILLIYIQIVFLVWIISYLRKKVNLDQYILPLDEVDAEKLTAMVDEQVVLHLKPLMQAKGYTDEQIQEILTSKPLGSQPIFRR